MDSIDKGLQQRVWQRVRSEPEPPSEPPRSAAIGPEGFLLEELTDANLLQRLAASSREPRSSLLRQAAGLCQVRAAALRGLCRVTGADLPSAPKPKPIDNPDAACRFVLGNLLRRSGEYEKLCSHGEFAPIHSLLAARCRESAFLLSQALGK